ncbi:hypothetical protein IMY05_009G0134100 [Salix suchowensis]|nr:hypothetical protein IMY05_009G0134100 [Salix suchowensis]
MRIISFGLTTGIIKITQSLFVLGFKFSSQPLWFTGLMLAWFNEFQVYRIASTLETSLECLRELYLMGGEQMSIQRSCTLQYCVKPFKLIQVVLLFVNWSWPIIFNARFAYSIRSFLAPSYECYRQYRMRLRVMGTLTENLIL